MTQHTTQRGADGAGLRVTSDQVDDMLSNDLIYSPTIYAICRDWLDMQARLAAADAVIAAVRSQMPEWAWDRYRHNPELQWPENSMQHKLINAVLAYDALTTPARDETKEKE